MALTNEIIKANSELTTLTDVQLEAITTLSTNDEATVISKKTGEHHGLLDADVLEISGEAKLDKEKSFDYMKRVMGVYKTGSVDVVTLKADALKHADVVAGLNKQIKDGSNDSVLKQQLSDAESALVLSNKALADGKLDWDKKELDFNTDISAIHVDADFSKASSSLKFKSAYPESVQTTLVQSAKTAVMSKYKTDFIDNGKGGKQMVYRDAEGEIARNSANSLKPFSTQELLKSELKEVLDETPVKPGGGTKPRNATDVDPVEITDVSGATSQVEADKIIVSYLLQKGVLKGSSEFAEQQSKLRTDNKVSSLKIK